MKRVAALAGTALILAAVLGCGNPQDAELIVRTGPQTADVRPNGTLAGDPALLTISDVEEQTGPVRVVVQLLFWAQWGGYPDIFSLYDADTIEGAGEERIRSAYEIARMRLVVAAPEILFNCGGSDRRLVGVRLRFSFTRPQDVAFVVQRTRDGWRIITDTIVDTSNDFGNMSAFGGAYSGFEAAQQAGDAGGADRTSTTSCSSGNA